MVDTALDLLFDEMNETKRPESPIKIKVPANLIVRESTSPPPHR
jgi:DNA-binding LacI/PurR family transcriptional regulator